MPTRLPWTIWKTLCWDLWRLIFLTAGVLVVVISFALVGQLLAGGKIGPAQVPKFMLLAMPPMLQYALPFAACFGATLAYHRFAADNEAIAAHAGGISHRTLLVPTALTGLGLACILLLLSNFIIPRFLRNMDEIVSQDFSTHFVHTIEQHEPVTLGDGRWLYADIVKSFGPDAATGSFERLWLGGLLVVKMDKAGDVDELASAQEATVWLRRTASAQAAPGSNASMTEVIIRPKDAVFQRRDNTRAQVGEVLRPFYIPSQLSDDPKYLSFTQLRALRQKPEGIDGITRRMRELAVTMAQQRVLETVRQSLRDRNRVEFTQADDRITLEAAELRPQRIRVPSTNSSNKTEVVRSTNRFEVLAPRGKLITVKRTFPDGHVQTLQSSGAEIIFPKAGSAAATGAGQLQMIAPGPQSDAGISMTLKFFEVSSRDVDESGELLAPGDDEDAAGVPQPSSAGSLKEFVSTDLRLANDPVKQLLATPARQLVQEANTHLAERNRPAEREAIRGPLNDLNRRIADLMREVMSKEQERLAMAAACLVMVLMGAVMAMRLRDSLPLTIYLWAFFPALATVITISAGQQLTHTQGVVGLLLLWGGVLGLGAYAATEFTRLARH